MRLLAGVPDWVSRLNDRYMIGSSGAFSVVESLDILQLAAVGFMEEANAKSKGLQLIICAEQPDGETPCSVCLG